VHADVYKREVGDPGGVRVVIEEFLDGGVEEDERCGVGSEADF
jgi:hypothetical protein